MSLFDTIRIMPAWLLVSESVVVTFGLVMAGYGLWQMRRDRLQQTCQIKRLQEQPTRPMPILLPAVLPAQTFDHSDKTPYVGKCPMCYGLVWLQSDDPRYRTADGGYLMPDGGPQFCADHANTRLARALKARKEMAR